MKHRLGSPRDVDKKRNLQFVLQTTVQVTTSVLPVFQLRPSVTSSSLSGRCTRLVTSLVFPRAWISLRLALIPHRAASMQPARPRRCAWARSTWQPARNFCASPKRSGPSNSAPKSYLSSLSIRELDIHQVPPPGTRSKIYHTSSRAYDPGTEPACLKTIDRTV